MSNQISVEIKNILDENMVHDLKNAIRSRKCLNVSNKIFIYLFHVVQTSGILVTTVGAGYSYKYLVWLGAGLNALATLIHVYEKTNNNMSKRLLADIKAIQAGLYVDEGELVDPENTPPTVTNPLPFVGADVPRDFVGADVPRIIVPENK